MVLAPLWTQLQGWKDWENATPLQRVMRFVTSAGYSLAFVVGGALIASGGRSGLFWIGAGDIAALGAVVLNAWVLMVEILR